MELKVCLHSLIFQRRLIPQLYRSECLKARVHRASWGGIHGWESFGADSIVLSGGYSDDIDEGETMCAVLLRSFSNSTSDDLS